VDGKTAAPDRCPRSLRTTFGGPDLVRPLVQCTAVSAGRTAKKSRVVPRALGAVTGRVGAIRIRPGRGSFAVVTQE